jgi:hypothetical protein
MTRRLIVVAVLLAATACCHEPAQRRPADAAPAAAAPPAVATATPPPAASPELAGKLGAKLHPGSQLPAQSGASAATIEGCLTSASEEAGQRYPAPATTRSASDQIELQPVPGGLVIVHQLAHACCLRGAVTSKIDGDAVIVTETLSGNPCRCMCGSTLRTAVRLAPGSYRLAVVVAHEETPYQGKTERVLERVVEVR